jgi:VWFA-related protein
MTPTRRRSRRTTVGLVAAAFSAVALAASSARPAAQETASTQAPFRARTDLVQIDVQVVDRDGRPVSGLDASQFDVTIAGDRRRVAFAQLVDANGTSVSVAGLATSAAAPDGPVVSIDPLAGRRVFMVAVDAMSFDVAVSRGVAEAAANFVRALPEDDLVGLYSYPLGPKVDPTSSHVAVVQALGRVSGQRGSALAGSHDVRPSDIVDYFAAVNAGRSRDVSAILARYCGDGGGGIERQCAAEVALEIENEGRLLETQARTSLGMLEPLLLRLSDIPGRKVLVLVSAGMPLSDRPGGRPDVGDLPIRLGESAARANVAIYTLYLDHRLLAQYSAETRHASRNMTNLGRDSDLSMRWLDQFSGTAGGALLRVLVDDGAQAFTRIVRETSAYYLLGVEPADADRTGRARQIKVKVRTRGLTVRARQWVVVPRAPERSEGGEAP